MAPQAGALAHPSAVVRQPVRDFEDGRGIISDVIAINASIDIVMGRSTADGHFKG
jgi:hypothetical protein